MNNKKIKRIIVVGLILVTLLLLIFFGYKAFLAHQDKQLNTSLYNLNEQIEQRAFVNGYLPISLETAGIRQANLEYFPVLNGYQYFICSIFKTNSEIITSSNQDYGRIVELVNRGSTFNIDNTRLAESKLSAQNHAQGRNCYYFESPRSKYLSTFNIKKCSNRYKYRFGQLQPLGIATNTLSVSTDIQRFALKRLPQNPTNISVLNLEQTKIVDSKCGDSSVRDIKSNNLLSAYYNQDLEKPELLVIEPGL